MAAIDDLIKQIQSQGTTAKWSGGYGADAAIKDMARLLADAGITDIKQFCKIPQYEPVEVIKTLYNGQEVSTQTGEDGKTSSYVYEPTGKMLTYNSTDTGEVTYPETRMVAVPKDAKLENVYGVFRERGGEVGGTYYEPVDPSKIKTVDGKLVADTGLTTFGNKETGQAVTNIYETGSNAFGGTYQGKGKTGYRVDFTPDGTPVFYTTGESSSDFKQYAPLLGIAGLAFGAPMLGDLLAGAGAGATELGALSALDAGMGVYPTLGISEAVGGTTLSALDAGMDTYPSTGTIGEAAATASKFPLSVSDTIRLAGIGATLAGGAKLVGSVGGTGSGGYDIVPIPADWTSPPPTSTAAFTPLPEIDFGNPQMLQGTQWEKLLSPDYGKAPAPTQYAQPSNMSYDELTRILGSSKTSVPTQSLTINDVIAGIQSQYGQAPKSAVG